MRTLTNIISTDTRIMLDTTVTLWTLDLRVRHT